MWGCSEVHLAHVSLHFQYIRYFHLSAQEEEEIDLAQIAREIELAQSLLASAGLRSDGSRVPAGGCAVMSQEDRGKETPNGFS